MATRTISNTGGNWNATGTWVEGIVPVAADDIVATATSGNVTVNVSASIRSFNFTNYVGTITVNNALSVGGTVSNVFVNTMTVAGTSRFRISGVSTLTSNSFVVPAIEFLSVVTLNDTLNVRDFFMTTAASINGNDIICRGNVTATNQSSVSMTDRKLRLIGTASHTISIAGFTRGQIEIDGSGTFNFTDASSLNTGLLLLPTTTGGTTFSYINGTLANPDLRIGAGSNGSIALDTASYSSGWNSVFIKNSHAGDVNLTLLNDLRFKNLIIMNEYSTNTPNTTRRSLNFIGPGVLAGTASSESFILPSFRGTGIARWNCVGVPVRLTSGLTYSFGNLFSYGFDMNLSTTSEDGNNLFYSSVTGSQAGINIVGTQSITFTDFTDISASQSVYTVLGQTSNVTNVTSIDRYYYTAGGGVSGGSFTFVN